MASLKLPGLQHCCRLVTMLRSHHECLRPINILCSRTFSTSVNYFNPVKKAQANSTLTNTDAPKSEKATSVFAELFSDDKSVVPLKTEIDNATSISELDKLEDLLNRRLSMKMKNTVLSTGAVYQHNEDINENLDSDHKTFFGESEEFVEEIEGSTDVSKEGRKSKLRQGEAYMYGSADPSVPMSESACAGCGATLHCQDPGIPGFVPSQIFLECPPEKLKRTICKRCYVLAKHKVALDVSASPEEYVKVLEQIKHKKGLILLVLDLLDLPNSIFKDFPRIIGEGRQVYVIGNKVDLLPKDSVGYLDRTKEMVQSYMNEYGFSRSSKVKHIALVSAKTGYGIEGLVSKLLVNWGRSGDVYVVGSTNVGKSTLFNALLSSDYCRSVSRDFILRATISNWPGTTMNTLKFPIINLSPWKMEKRKKRIQKDRTAEVEEEILRRKNIQNSRRISIADATLNGKIGQTFLNAKDKAVHETGDDNFTEVTYSSNPEAAEITESQSDQASIMSRKIKGIMAKYDAESLDSSRYCYDTPGVVNPQQIINLLKERELTVMLPKRLIMPRTFTMLPQQTMFVTGLGRLDYLEGKRSAFFTVICSTAIPIHIVETVEADSFYSQHVGTEELGVPLGDADRLNQLPPLVGKEFSVACCGWNTCAADIILSSLGWVSITGFHQMEVKVKAYTPQGHGCVSRSPSLLPNAVNLKGRRIRGTKAYHPKMLKLLS